MRFKIRDQIPGSWSHIALYRSSCGLSLRNEFVQKYNFTFMIKPVSACWALLEPGDSMNGGSGEVLIFFVLLENRYHSLPVLMKQESLIKKRKN